MFIKSQRDATSPFLKRGPVKAPRVSVCLEALSYVPARPALRACGASGVGPRGAAFGSLGRQSVWERGSASPYLPWTTAVGFSPTDSPSPIGLGRVNKLCFTAPGRASDPGSPTSWRTSGGPAAVASPARPPRRLSPRRRGFCPMPSLGPGRRDLRRRRWQRGPQMPTGSRYIHFVVSNHRLALQFVFCRAASGFANLQC